MSMLSKNQAKQMEEEWTEVITAKTNLFDLKLREIWQYRDLVAIFVRRDFVAGFKQTILGPIWMFIGPLMGGIINVIIFNSIANISTDGAPPILFQMLSIAVWQYFLNCFNGAAGTFRSNAGIFSKVYFPRLTVPIASSVSAIFSLGIRFILIGGLWIYFATQGAVTFQGIKLLLLPVLLLILAVLGISLGIVAAAITLKYKDINNFVAYGTQFLLYLSAVVYPISVLPENFQFLADYNPLVPIFESARNIVLGTGILDLQGVGVAAVITLVFAVPAIMIFNYTERTFVDKV